MVSMGNSRGGFATMQNKAGNARVLRMPQRHYQWSALPLSYSSATANSLTESTDGPQPQKPKLAITGKFKRQSAGVGGEKVGSLFTLRCARTVSRLFVGGSPT